jgi:translation initiation factor 2B subunit (eIF-2B alpha/beta/delta family)
MARFLSEAGISVCYMIDALLPEMLSNADLLLLGADLVAPGYFINKTGTTTLLKASGGYDIITAVVFESLKASQPDKYKAVKLDYNSRELWAGKKPANITIVNQYFEPIPNQLVGQFISDYGIDNPDSLSKRIEGLI